MKPLNDGEVADSGTTEDGVEMRPWSKSLSKILIQDFQELHRMVADSPLLVRMREGEPSRADYMVYLTNVHSDTSVVEGHLRQQGDAPPLQLIDFEPLYRAEALREDMAALGVPRVEPLPCTRYHRAYFDVVANHAPHLLVAHAAVRYLRLLLRGGQQSRERLYEYWGDAGTYRLYEFPRPNKELAPTFLRQLDAFYDSLDELERARFYNEVITAWEFSGDLLENTIRCVSIRYRPSLAMTSVACA